MTTSIAAPARNPTTTARERKRAIQPSFRAASNTKRAPVTSAIAATSSAARSSRSSRLTASPQMDDAMRGRAGDARPTVEAIDATAAVPEESGGDQRLAILLAMAMFVLVVDTSLMNVSISAVVQDLDTTASGVQSAIALEALVSAAFILIGSKIGDLFGRKRAFVLGLLGYAVGALSMTLSQSLVPIIVFWAIIGGLGASLLLPSMQSLIPGNFEGAERKRAYAMVGAAAGIAAAVGPLVGGFITTFLSWRVAFGGEVVIIAIVLLGSRRVHEVPYTGDRRVDVVGAILSAGARGGVAAG